MCGGARPSAHQQRSQPGELKLQRAPPAPPHLQVAQQGRRVRRAGGRGDFRTHQQQRGQALVDLQGEANKSAKEEVSGRLGASGRCHLGGVHRRLGPARRRQQQASMPSGEAGIRGSVERHPSTPTLEYQHRTCDDDAPSGSGAATQSSSCCSGEGAGVPPPPAAAGSCPAACPAAVVVPPPAGASSASARWCAA